MAKQKNRSVIISKLAPELSSTASNGVQLHFVIIIDFSSNQQCHKIFLESKKFATVLHVRTRSYWSSRCLIKISQLLVHVIDRRIFADCVSRAIIDSRFAQDFFRQVYGIDTCERRVYNLRRSIIFCPIITRVNALNWQFWFFIVRNLYLSQSREDELHRHRRKTRTWGARPRAAISLQDIWYFYTKLEIVTKRARSWDRNKYRLGCQRGRVSRLYSPFFISSSSSLNSPRSSYKHSLTIALYNRLKNEHCQLDPERLFPDENASVKGVNAQSELR